MRLYFLPILLVLLYLIGCDQNNTANNGTHADIDRKTSATKNGEIPATDTASSIAATTIDAAVGKRVAESCMTCHTIAVNAPNNAVPFITGQHTQYLVNSLTAYTDGTRTAENKKELFSSLSEIEKNSVVNYYAEKPRNWRGKAKKKTKSTPTFSKKSLTAAKNMASSCFSCHGPEGNSQKPGIPSIAGLHADYLQKALEEYLKGGRDNEFMKVFKHVFDQQQISQLSAYFSTRQRSKTKLPISGKVKTGKQLAKTACDSCHGISGNSAVASIPSLSGQNEKYLINAINAYKTGARKNSMMKSAVNNLSKQNIKHIASYYAVQSPTTRITQKPKEATFDPITDGQTLSAACASCHGKSGNSELPGTPSLNRLSVDYLQSAIMAYKEGDRHHSLMQFFVQSLNEYEIRKLALYYALQEPSVTKNTGDPANVETVSEIIAGCAACHGENGNSSTPSTPSLAGQDADYLAKAISDYQSAKRKHEDMQKATAELKPQDISTLAHYYATKSPTLPATRVPDTPQDIAQRCSRCHGENGISSDNTVPILAGQSEQYLIKSLQDYKVGVRKKTAMHAMADVLDPLEVQAIAAYYSALQP